MVDLHCHVLPGIDDGPATLEESLELARAAASSGVTTLVATPHVSWRYVNDAAIIARERDAVRHAVDAAGVALAVVSGAEIAVPRLGDLTDEDLEGLRLGDGPWLLIEAPLTSAVGDVAPIVDGLHARGHGIVLAHPERSPLFLRDPQSLGRLVAQGVLCSITASSLSGAFGREIQRFARDLLREKLVHNICSDAHDTARRPPVIRDHLADAAMQLPELSTRLEWLTTEMPLAIISGDVLPDPPAGRRFRRGRRR